MQEAYDEQMNQTMKDMLAKLEEIKLSILMLQYSMQASGDRADHASTHSPQYAAMAMQEEDMDTTADDIIETIHSVVTDPNLDENGNTMHDIDK
jgi:hypothetical protein